MEKIQSSKGKKAVRNEIHSACTELVDEAYYGEGGEQLWVGMLPKRIVSKLADRLPREQVSTDKMQIPNKWRHSILRILKLLAGGTQLAWQAKEKARSDRLSGIVRSKPTARNNIRRRTRNQDIRILYRRAAYEQAQRQEQERIRKEFESIASSTLVNETSTAPINAIRRLRRLNIARALKTKRPSTTGHHHLNKNGLHYLGNIVTRYSQTKRERDMSIDETYGHGTGALFLTWDGSKTTMIDRLRKGMKR